MEANNDYEANYLNKNKKNIGIITCTKMNKYYLFPFITPIFITIRDIMINSIMEENSKDEDISFYFIYASCISIFLALGGLIYFLFDIRVFIEKRKTELYLRSNIRRKKDLKKKHKLKIF